MLQEDLKLLQINIMLINKKIKVGPRSKTETPNKGIAIKTAGTKPIKVLKIAVKVKSSYNFSYFNWSNK